MPLEEVIVAAFVSLDLIYLLIVSHVCLSEQWTSSIVLHHICFTLTGCSPEKRTQFFVEKNRMGKGELVNINPVELT